MIPRCYSQCLYVRYIYPLRSPARRLLKAIRIIKWIADVNRISANELVRRKAKLVLAKTESQKTNLVLAGLYDSWSIFFLARCYRLNAENSIYGRAWSLFLVNIHCGLVVCLGAWCWIKFCAYCPSALIQSEPQHNGRWCC
jgi:hypothetical protein